MKKYYYIMDSYAIKSEVVNLIKKLDLELYFQHRDGVWSSDFVGVILSKDAVIVSFPKYFYGDRFEINNGDIKLISELLINMKSRYGLELYEESNLYNNFPLVSYMYICNYYIKYGLYNQKYAFNQKGYSGNINWKKTIRDSQWLISGKNLIYMPFILDNSIFQEVFITECMVYALHEGFRNFGYFFNVGVEFNKKTNNPIFKNKKLVIKKLNYLKQNYFKDTERIIINHLINYFRWSNNYGNKVILATKNFEIYWEYLVEKYLNKNLYEIDTNGKFIFKANANKYRFRKRKEHIESPEVRKKGLSRNFSVEYDHLYIDKSNMAYLFDSKYYRNINSLDYKQLAYFFILRESSNYTNKNIINGLVMPTNHDYYCKIHLDARDRGGVLKGVFIVEHYLNMRKIIESIVVN